MSRGEDSGYSYCTDLFTTTLSPHSEQMKASMAARSRDPALNVGEHQGRSLIHTGGSGAKAQAIPA